MVGEEEKLVEFSICLFTHSKYLFSWNVYVCYNDKGTVWLSVLLFWLNAFYKELFYKEIDTNSNQKSVKVGLLLSFKTRKETSTKTLLFCVTALHTGGGMAQLQCHVPTFFRATGVRSQLVVLSNNKWKKIYIIR